MPEDRLIDPSWLVKARRDRRRFAVRIAIVFGVMSVLTWWALPRLETQHKVFEGARTSVRAGKTSAAPTAVTLLAKSAGLFQVFLTAIAAGCGVAMALAFTGKIDNLLPFFNLVVLFVGAGSLALTFYVFYAPTLLLIKG